LLKFVNRNCWKKRVAYTNGKTAGPRFITHASPMFFLSFLVWPPTQALYVWRFIVVFDRTQWHTTLSGNPVDELSARRRDLYLTTHNIYKRQTSMPPVVFETLIPGSEPPLTHALDHVATGIGSLHS
jgi:hypothetical protein